MFIPEYVKRISPSRPHVPQHKPSARATGDPPASGTFLSFPPEKKPTCRPSGDQNGDEAPAVSGTTLASALSRARTNSMGGSPGRRAVNASLVPSGETAGTWKSMAYGAGGATVNRTGGRAAGALRMRVPITASDAARARPSTATAVHSARAPVRVGAAAAQGSPAGEPPSAIHRSSSATSCAVSHRSSGFLARHLFTTRSSEGGVSGCSVDERRRLRVHECRRSGSPGSRPRTPAGPSPSRRGSRRAPRGPSARRPPSPRVAPAPCTAACRRSCPAP